MKLLLWIVWAVLGFCIALGGCRARLSAEKLEASIAIDQTAYLDQKTNGEEHEPDERRSESD